MGSVVIRPLTPDDWPVWRELRRRALAEDPDAFGSTLEEWSGAGDREERWRARLTSVPFNLVASLAGRDSGMASATAPHRDEVELISMWVAAKARRSGVATALVDAVVGFGRRCGVARVALDVREANHGAIDLYRACGFVDVGPSPNHEPGAPERRMHRSLSPDGDHREQAAAG